MPLLDTTSAPFGERRLAAIMFTDVVNFSTLVGEDEERTLAAVQRDFELIFVMVAQSGGRVLKTMGDGMLAHFGGAVNAVTCAQKIQLAIVDAARVQPDRLNLRHRIGIHLGDVFVSEHDMFGNGVNIAARLQARAAPGGICISQTIFDVVKNKLALQVSYLGPQELNHIRESIPAYLVIPQRTPMPVASSTGPNIALETVLSPRKQPAAALEFAVDTRRAEAATLQRRSDGPFTLAVVGDFSGRGSRSAALPLADRRALRVDIDNFDDVFSQLGVRISLPAYQRPGATTEIGLESFEHFHPDELMQRVAPLAELLSLRRALSRPGSAAAAAAKLRALLSPAPPTANVTEEKSVAESDSDTLGRLLNRPAGNKPVGRTAAAINPVNALVKTLVDASTSGAAALNPSVELAALDLELTSGLRAVLHHPDFQALEAVWRGVKRLVRDFGDGGAVKLLLVDASRHELTGHSAEFATLLRGYGCHAVLTDLAIGPDPSDISLLTELAQATATSGAQILAGARPELAGCDSFARTPDPDNWDIALPTEVDGAWQTLRRSTAATHVVLTAPRLLLRQPYGKWSDAIESFAFEELPPNLSHESFLWGNAAFACAHVLAAEFVHGGSSKRNFTGGEIGGLPLYRFTQDGETTVKPCAEAWLTERAASVLEARGVTTLHSVKGRDAARITRIVSIALAASQRS